VSTEDAKFKHSKRLLKEENAVKRQLKIAKQHNSFPDENNVIKQPHRLSKHHAMDCGRPGCAMCGNPRHIHKDSLTAQEKRLFQDVDHVRYTHSNGLITKDDDDQDN
jgi:hypothetical protein